MSRDSNFAQAFLFLSPLKRRAIVAVWDVCRAIDDAVDEYPLETNADREQARTRLAEWRKEIHACFASGVWPHTPQGVALQPFVRLFRFSKRLFDDLIDGVAMDIGPHTRYRTFKELHSYCYRVASTVGLICVDIFGAREAASRDYAVDLGVALQLTNILRDVPTDLTRDRVYIPLEDMERFHCSEEMLQDQWRTPPVIALLRFQAERARHYYFRAARLLPRRERRRLAAAEIMGATYYALLNEIERRNYDVFTETVGLPSSEKASLAFKTWLRALTGGRSYIELLTAPVPAPGPTVDPELVKSRTNE
jgi:15-cis-phytoene synthase